MESLDIFIKQFNFKEVRNEILKEFYLKVQKDENSKIPLLKKYQEYLKNNNNKLIKINDFQYEYDNDSIYLCHVNDDKCSIRIKEIKLFKIYKNKNLPLIEEYICGEEYLQYIIQNVYKMKNPKFYKCIDDIGNDEISTISLTNEDYSNIIKQDYKIICDFCNNEINYENIEKYKHISVFNKEKSKDEYFINLVGLNKFKNPMDMYKNGKFKHSSIDILIKNIKKIQTKTLIFHNENDFLPLDIFLQFNNLYYLDICGYFYFNFELLKKLTKIKRLEYFVYCLLSLFPRNNDIKEFFENNIKNHLKKDIKCIPNIIKLILDYLEKKFIKINNDDNKIIFNKELTELLTKFSNNYNLTKDEITGLYTLISDYLKNNEINKPNPIENKKYYIFFDEINNKDLFYMIENIIKNYNTNPNFYFIIIIPLNNEFTYKLFFDNISNNNELYFANFNDINDKDEDNKEQNLEKFDIDIFNNQNEEEIFYDLLRLFHFETIYYNNINSNNYSIISLKKYIKYLNIEFDNKLKKISKIRFKNTNIEKIFLDKYINLLNYIKVKDNHKFNNLEKHMDYFDLEKIIISVIISEKQKEKDDFLELFVHSIFGFQHIEKKENIDYNIKNFIIKQRSMGAEAFDFAIKIRIGDKNYLKIYQVTVYKSDDDLEKLCIEKILIYLSFIKYKYEENNLGHIDGISFGIISSTEIFNKLVYKKLKKYCRQNSYEFILFDLNEGNFKIRKNSKYEEYDKQLFQFDPKYKLEIKEFKDIINTNNDLNMISSRPIKGKIIENDQNNKSQKFFNENCSEQKIKKVAKFNYKGKFNDIKKLDKNYFIYYYDNKNKYYFYDDKIYNLKNENKYRKEITVILYSIIHILDIYEDSSIEIKKNIPKKKGRK